MTAHEKLDARGRGDGLAKWAALVLERQDLEAKPMDLVPAPQLHAHALTAVVHMLVAARAQVLRHVLMVVFCTYVHADFAVVTVEEIIAAACLARATLIAVEYLLARVIVKQVAVLAEVFSEGDLAFATRFLWWLHGAASVALDLFDGLAVEAVRPCYLAFLAVLTPVVGRYCSRLAVYIDVVAEATGEE